MERVQLWPTDESALICDPQGFDALKGIREDDPSIAHPYLKHRTILLAPLLRYFRVVLAELMQIAKDWYARNFR